MGEQLTKKYGLPTAVAMVIGIVIGSGIFFKAEKILTATGGDLKTGILAWVIGGLIAIVSACAFAVMATRYENVGGVVDYAESTVGPGYAYSLGWFMATIYFPCLTGTLAWVAARYTCVLLGYDIVGGHCMTLTMLYLIAIYFMNSVAPMLAGKLQVSLTVIKLIPIVLMGVIGTIAGLRSGLIVENFTTVLANDAIQYPLFTAMGSTAFAYEGWIIATTINAELKNAKRNLPLALVFGVGAIMVVYLLYYIGIAGAVPNAVMMENGEQGARLAYSAIFGNVAGTGLFVFVVLSCLGTCNGLMMASSRGFYALAARGRGPKPELYAQVDRHTNMPNNAAALGLFMCTLWGFYFYFGTLQSSLGPFKFDSSELPILTLYAMYIPVYLMFMLKCKDETPFRRFVLPLLATAGAVFMVFSGIISYKMDCLYYLLIYAVLLIIGWLFRGKLYSSQETPSKGVR